MKILFEMERKTNFKFYFRNIFVTRPFKREVISRHKSKSSDCAGEIMVLAAKVFPQVCGATVTSPALILNTVVLQVKDPASRFCLMETPAHVFSCLGRLLIISNTISPRLLLTRIKSTLVVICLILQTN